MVLLSLISDCGVGYTVLGDGDTEKRSRFLRLLEATLE